MTDGDLKQHCAGSGIDWAPGEHGGQQGYWLHWRNPNDAADEECSFLPTDALAGAEWEKLQAFVVNGRDVLHYSRVVGYWSRMQNWNPSKIGELRDRHKGDYGAGGGDLPTIPAQG